LNSAWAGRRHHLLKVQCQQVVAVDDDRHVFSPGRSQWSPPRVFDGTATQYLLCHGRGSAGRDFLRRAPWDGVIAQLGWSPTSWSGSHFHCPARRRGRRDRRRRKPRQCPCPTGAGQLFCCGRRQQEHAPLTEAVRRVLGVSTRNAASPGTHTVLARRSSVTSE
jgi:hypothetical protein